MKSVDTITVVELSIMAEKMYGNLVKAVVDLRQNSMVVDAEMHADEEEYLNRAWLKTNRFMGNKPISVQIWN